MSQDNGGGNRKLTPPEKEVGPPPIRPGFTEEGF